MIADIRSQPRLRRRAAAALKHEAPVRALQPFGHQPAGFAELSLVARVSSQRNGNAVRGVYQGGGTAAFFRNLLEGIADIPCKRFDKSGMVVEDAQLVDLRRSRANRLQG